MQLSPAHVGYSEDSIAGYPGRFGLAGRLDMAEFGCVAGAALLYWTSKTQRM